jgi:hypothetical protein
MNSLHYLSFEDTADLSSGIEQSMTELIDFKKDSGERIKRVKKYKILESPQYLFVNFMRFFWKQKEGIKAKILKVRLFLS